MSLDSKSPAEKPESQETRKLVNLAIDGIDSQPQQALNYLHRALKADSGDPRQAEALVNEQLVKSGLLPRFVIAWTKDTLSGAQEKQFSASDLKVLGQDGKPPNALYGFMLKNIIDRYDTLRKLDGDGTGVSLKDFEKWAQKTKSPGEEKDRKDLIKGLRLEDKADQSLKKGRYLYDVAKEKLEFMHKENPDTKKAPVTNKDVFAEVAKMMSRSDRGAKFSELDPKAAGDLKQKAVPNDWNNISSKDKLEVFTKGELQQIKKWRDARKEKGDPLGKIGPRDSEVGPKVIAPALVEVKMPPVPTAKPADKPAAKPVPAAPLQGTAAKIFNSDGETVVNQPDGSVLKVEMRGGKIVAMERARKLTPDSSIKAHNEAVDDTLPENHRIVDGALVSGGVAKMITTEYANGTLTLREPEANRIRRVDTIVDGKRFVFQPGKGGGWESVQVKAGEPAALRGHFKPLPKGTSVAVDQSGRVKLVSAN